MTQNIPVHVYIDGACRGNPGPGAWAAILIYKEHEKEISGVEPHTTNNRMELLAAIQALQHLKKKCQVIVTTDSEYVRKGICQWVPVWKANQWRKKDKSEIKNLDLWQLLDNATKNHEIEWHWVKGHNGHPGNERADKLANIALDNWEKQQKC